MTTPTTAQLLTAIEVLEKLNDRIRNHAASSVRQMPGSIQAGQLLRQINGNMTEQMQRNDAVVGQLKNWRAEILEQSKRTISCHV